MLKKLRLTDFKSFVNEEVELAPLTLLVGANASGKSNFLDAIQFLRATHFDLSIADILNGEERAYPYSEAWPGLRGRAAEAARVGTSVFSIESLWRTPDIEDVYGKRNVQGQQWGEVRHRIACRTDPYPRLEAESLAKGDGELLFSTGAVKDNRIEVPGWKLIPWPGNERKESPALLDADRSLQWIILGSINPGSPSVPPVVAQYSHALSEAVGRIGSLDIKPEQMRGYGRKGMFMDVAGKNISGLLAAMSEQLETKRALVDWLAEFCAPEITDIDFIEVKELGDIMAMFVEAGGKRISVRSLSEGTLRFLGILLSLRMAEPGSVMLIEDIEMGLHPTRIRLLSEYLENVVRERNIQVIATTHSPVVLQWVNEETLRSTVVFGRVSDYEGTLMRRLGDLPHFDQVARHKGIEELFTTGWLEMAL
ncbi:MAG TPA: AAA family ATPase [Myxococcaceae bacterium]|nr:AAA family ATPase [Myxococcaceae bacterium]